MSTKRLLLLTVLLIIFFLPRLLLLHTYPPFNDESIHLAWARLMVTDPDARFISMNWGGKQPLPFWLFGLAGKLTPSNLFLSSRLVSLGFSLLALIGIYKLTFLVASGRGKNSPGVNHRDSSDSDRGKKNSYLAAIFASIAFALSPFAIFLSVQVLMEIMVFAAGVWAFYFLLLLLNLNRVKDAVVTGVILSIGFWLKSTMIIFIGLAFLTIFATIFVKLAKNQQAQAKTLRLPTIAMIISLALILLPLITHPSFAYLSQWNKLYGFSFAELARFPISRWITNMLIGLTWYLWYLTPFFLLLALWPTHSFIWIYGSRIGLKLRSGKKLDSHSLRNILLLIFWFFFAYLATSVVIRSPSLRYFLPSTFPLFPLFGLSLAKIYRSGIGLKLRSGKNWFLLLVFFSLAFSSTVLAIKPHIYILWLDRFAPFTNDRFHLVSGWPSGYGVPEAIDFIKAQSKKSPLLLLIRYDSGNPEDAMLAAFLENPRVEIQMIGQLPEKEREIIVNQLKKQPLPVYFVSRGSQLAGLNKYLIEVKHFNKPASKEYIGVYELKVQN